MKKFIQMLLAGFGIFAIMLAGCSTQGGAEDSGDDDGGVVIEEDAGEEDVAE